MTDVLAAAASGGVGDGGPRRATALLTGALDRMEASTTDAFRCCEQLSRRARQLDSLTSPASDASSMLSRANANLTAALGRLRDAREKFDTVADCEPALERLHRGVAELTELEQQKRQGGRPKAGLAGRGAYTEQDVYAAGDSVDILRDSYTYFLEHNHWRSTPSYLSELERCHRKGLEAMSLLIRTHLKKAGQAVRPKRKKVNVATDESAPETRARLAAALLNRDLLKSIGEYEEYQPLEARPIREIHSIFECLGSYGYHLGPPSKREPQGLSRLFGIPPQRVVRTEKVGSGAYTNLLNEATKVGFPQLDAYAEARKEVAHAALDNYYRRVKQDRKKKLEKAAAAGTIEEIDEADAAAKDAVRCLEHAMIVVAGEKSVYRAIISPSVAMNDGGDEEGLYVSPYYKKACAGAYSYVVGAVVNRSLDIIETVFLKEGGIGQTSGTKSGGVTLTVPAAASAAASGLRILDGVRMLGPSLAKLCEINVDDGVTDSNSSIAAILCIAIHRTTVKNTARTLENLAKAIQEDPMKGPFHRPKDASVSSVSRDVVNAIRLISPFVSAYKTVSKRRSLQWDPNMGEEAGELDSFVRFLVMRLLNSLKGKALNYTKDGRDDGQARSNLFLINNAFYLLEELGPGDEDSAEDKEVYRIEGSWFSDKITKLMDSERAKYLSHWEILKTHLTAVGDLEYQKNDSMAIIYDSGKLIKARFSGFNEDFERTYQLHKKLCIIDPRLRIQIQEDVAKVFLPRYARFYDKYAQIKFSKKHQSEYTKYSPEKIESMLSELYTDPDEQLHSQYE